MSTLALLALAALAAAPQQSAESESLGVGSLGSAGRPELRIEGSPIVGNPFRLSLTNAKPSASAFVQIGRTATPVYVPQFGATIHALAPLVASHAAPTDAFGDSSEVVALDPVLASHVGIEFVAQGIVFDGAAKGGLAFTPTRRIVVGAPSSTAIFADERFGVPGLSVMAHGDFDGDGAVDVAYFDTVASTLMVTHIDQQGRLEAPTALFPAVGAVALEVADVEGDGDIDLCFVELGTNSLCASLNDGQGSFSSPVKTPLTDTCFEIDAADFDEDGNVDVCVSLQFDGVGMYRGLGDGSFVLVDNAPVGFSGADTSAIGDINGDGILDIASVGYFGFVSYLARLAGNGDGTFEPLLTEVLSPACRSVELADFDGDGRSDVVLGCGPTNTVVRFSESDWTWTTQVVVPTPVASNPGVAAADLNTDGALDFVVRGNDALSTATYRGNREFDTPQSTPLGNSVDIAFADFSGDGDLDLLSTHAASGGMGTHIGLGDGRFASAPRATTSGVVLGVVACEVGDDGFVDVACLVPSLSRIDVFLGRKDGTVVQGDTLQLGFTPYAFAAGDLDGDGDSDLVVTSGAGASVQVFQSTDGGRFRPKAPVGVSVAAQGVKLGDLDGDGDLDAVVINGPTQRVIILLGDGSGNLAVANTYPSVGTANLALGDLNEDGHLDIVTTSGSAMSILDGVGNGVFAAPRTSTVPHVGFGFEVGDVNGDGRLDIASCSAASSTKLRVFLGNGDGTVQAPIDVEVGYVGDVTLGDVDGDAILEVLVASILDQQLEVIDFSTATATPTRHVFGTAGAGRSVVAADFDRDGLVDAAVGEAPGTLVFLFNRLID